MHFVVFMGVGHVGQIETDAPQTKAETRKQDQAQKVYGTTEDAHPGVAALYAQGDVLLVEGRSRVSEVIKIITQSSWTHSALYIGRLFDIDDKVLQARIRGSYEGDPSEQLLVEALNTARLQGKFDQLVLLAAPAVLGVIRKTLNGGLAEVVVKEIPKDVIGQGEEKIKAQLVRSFALK